MDQVSAKKRKDPDGEKNEEKKSKVGEQAPKTTDTKAKPIDFQGIPGRMENTIILPTSDPPINPVSDSDSWDSEAESTLEFEDFDSVNGLW